MDNFSNKIRRVVTGHTEKGKSVIVSDEVVDGFEIGANRAFIKLWGNDSVPVHPDNGEMLEGGDWLPKAGGHRFYIWVVPPHSRSNKSTASQENVEELLPGFLKHFEPENPGMHTTDTVDCTYLISGAAIMELDDGVKVNINQGDSVIQNGTRHRWFNDGNIPAVFITTCIGSQRIV